MAICNVVLIFGLVQLLDPDVARADIGRVEAYLIWRFILDRAIFIEGENFVILRALYDLALGKVY